MRFNLDLFGTITDVRTDRRMAGSELFAHCEKGAARLAGLGARPGTTVVIRQGGTPRFFGDLFAVWTSGAAAAVVNSSLTPSELENIVSFLSPVAVLVDGEGEGEVAGCPAVDLQKPGKDGVLAATSSPDDDALILFTSGTTGEPKGVVHSFRSLIARAALNRVHIGDADLQHTLCLLPVHFGHGLIGNCLTALLAGGNLALGAGGDLKFVATVGDAIDRFEVSFMSSVPAFWKIVQKAAKPPRRATLRRIHIGSAPLSTELWRGVVEWSGTRNVANMYGITETANWIGGASAGEHGIEDGLIGRLWGGAAAVMGLDGRVSTVGEGELIVQTPSLMKGYLRRPDLTASCFVNGWFRTGDIGRIDETGLMRLVGRQKHEINRGGLKVHPEDIDILLERHPQVCEACAFGVPDPVFGEAVAVAVVPAGADLLDTRALAEWVSARLSAEKVPLHWHVVTEIPRSDRGKINRAAVAEYCLAQKRKAAK